MLPGRLRLWRAELELRKTRLLQTNERKLCKIVKDGREIEREGGRVWRSSGH